VCACVRACVRARVCVHVCTRVCVRVHMRVCVCGFFFWYTKFSTLFFSFHYSKNGSKEVQIVKTL